MIGLEQHILQQIQASQDVLEQTHSDPTLIISSLQQWQDQLQEAGSQHHLVWCFAPHLCLWYGPTVPVSLRTSLAVQKLRGVPVWSLQQEDLALGHSTADTLVLAAESGFTIYVRPHRYREKLAQDLVEAEPAFLSLLQSFPSHEEFLSWRQELNLLHEWGHIATDSSLPYKEPLLAKMNHFPPQDALFLLGWIKTLLEMLADLFPNEGALFLLPELGQTKNTRELAQMLLLDRLIEYRNNGLAAEFLGFYRWAQQISAEPQPDWRAFSLCCGKLGEILQEQLLQSIHAIPKRSSELQSWLKHQQQIFHQQCLAIFGSGSDERM